MKITVGIVFLTDLPDGRRVAVLQRRGKFNPENMKEESYPGATQVTAHGGKNEGESIEQALLREVGEELGTETRLILFGKCLFPLFNNTTDDRTDTTFGVLLENPSFLRHIRLGPASGGLCLVTQETEIRNLKDFDKKNGVTDLNTVAMFPDEIAAVKKAFDTFPK